MFGRAVGLFKHKYIAKESDDLSLKAWFQLVRERRETLRRQVCFSWAHTPLWPQAEDVLQPVLQLLPVPSISFSIFRDGEKFVLELGALARRSLQGTARFGVQHQDHILMLSSGMALLWQGAWWKCP